MTRTKRVLVAFRLLIEDEGAGISSRALSLATGARAKTCASDLALLRRFVPLQQVSDGPHVSWALPGREARTRAQAAYELRAAGSTWPEAAELAGYATISGAMCMAKRFAEV